MVIRLQLAAFLAWVPYTCAQNNAPDLGSTLDNGSNSFTSWSDDNTAASLPETSLVSVGHLNAALSMEINHQGLGRGGIMMRRHASEASALEDGWHEAKDSFTEQGAHLQPRIGAKKIEQFDKSNAMPWGSQPIGERLLPQVDSKANAKHHHQTAALPAPPIFAANIASLGARSPMPAALFSELALAQSAAYDFAPDEITFSQYINQVAGAPLSSAPSSASAMPKNHSVAAPSAAAMPEMQHDCKQEEWIGVKKLPWCHCLRNGKLGGGLFEIFMADYVNCDSQGNIYDMTEQGSKKIKQLLHENPSAQCDLYGLSAACIADVGCEGPVHVERCLAHQKALPHCAIDCKGTQGPQKFQAQSPAINKSKKKNKGGAHHLLSPSMLIASVFAAFEVMI